MNKRLLLLQAFLAYFLLLPSAVESKKSFVDALLGKDDKADKDDKDDKAKNDKNNKDKKNEEDEKDALSNLRGSSKKDAPATITAVTNSPTVSPTPLPTTPPTAAPTLSPETVPPLPVEDPSTAAQTSSVSQASLFNDQIEGPIDPNDPSASAQSTSYVAVQRDDEAIERPSVSDFVNTLHEVEPQTVTAAVEEPVETEAPTTVDVEEDTDDFYGDDDDSVFDYDSGSTGDSSTKYLSKPSALQGIIGSLMSSPATESPVVVEESPGTVASTPASTLPPAYEGTSGQSAFDSSGHFSTEDSLPFFQQDPAEASLTYDEMLAEEYSVPQVEAPSDSMWPDEGTPTANDYSVYEEDYSDPTVGGSFEEINQGVISSQGVSAFTQDGDDFYSDDKYGDDASVLPETNAQPAPTSALQSLLDSLLGKNKGTEPVAEIPPAAETLQSTDAPQIITSEPDIVLPPTQTQPPIIQEGPTIVNAPLDTLLYQPAATLFPTTSPAVVPESCSYDPEECFDDLDDLLTAIAVYTASSSRGEMYTWCVKGDLEKLKAPLQSIVGNSCSS